MTTDMITLTFAEMQAFINYVIDNTLIYGMGYKEVLIQYCTAKFYGKIEFESDDIAEIYDNEYEKLYSDYAINKGQLKMIENAINEELDRRIKFLSASMVMADANDAIANLATKLSNFVNAFGNAYSETNSEDVKTIAQAMSKLKNDVTADSLIKAMVDNGVIKGKKKATKKPKTVTEVAENEEIVRNISVSKGGK
jgi:hypothetical protein|nr:MAG TPA: hypothetical protein [Caudoviricetes sp.]